MKKKKKKSQHFAPPPCTIMEKRNHYLIPSSCTITKVNTCIHVEVVTCNTTTNNAKTHANQACSENQHT